MSREIGVMVLRPAGRRGPLYGGVSTLEAGAFQSFLVGYLAYHDGRLNAYQRQRVFLFEHYWLIPLFVVLCAAAIGIHARAWTERVAARRLSAPSARLVP